MDDLLHNLPVPWMALVIFGFTYLLAAVIQLLVAALAPRLAGSFKARDDKIRRRLERTTWAAQLMKGMPCRPLAGSQDARSYCRFASGALLCATPAAAYDPEDPANCIGLDWDDAHPVVLAKVTARPRVNFVKSPYDDDFKADSCPAATASCRSKSYLVTGDLVLAGRTRGDFTCVVYSQGAGKKPFFTRAWLPSTALTPLAATAAPRMSDWVGNWDQRYAGIEIKEGGIGGRLQIEGIAAFKGARDVHTGAIDAQVMPDGDTIAFLDDGWLPFETKCDSGCRVRMHRVGTFLLVEDNGGCGGAGVTFTGLYRRK